ncbi:MAG: tetratricopeptide repeat protein [Gemmataceae bacterium]|nr:tetratricopeptide repeat protein [Gemmataceae bacterium]
MNCVPWASVVAIAVAFAIPSQGADADVSHTEVLNKLEKDIGKKSVQEKELYLALLLQTKQFSKGVKAYSDLFPNEQDDVPLLYIHYRLLAGDLEFDKSNVVMGRLKKKLPANARLLHENGRVIQRRGEPNLAAAYFEKAIEIDPLFAPPYYELAKLSKDRKQTIQYAAKALSLVEPGSDMAKDVLELIARLQASEK